MLLYTPIFWLAGTNSWLAVRWTFILNGIIAAISVWAALYAVRSLELRTLGNRAHDQQPSHAPVIAAALWFGSYSFVAQMTNGLETGLYSLLLLFAIILLARISTREDAEENVGFGMWLLLGIVLGCAVLTRIDAAILVAILVFWFVWKRKILPALIAGGAAFVVSAPWWLFNWTHFGTLMPSSGQAENSWPLPPLENITQATKAISDIATLVFFLPGPLGPVVRAMWAVLLIVGIVFLFTRHKMREALRHFRLRVLAPFLAFFMVLAVYYTFFFRAPHFIGRYFQPGRIIWSLAASAGAWALWRGKSRIARCALAAIAIAGIAFSIHEYAFVYFPSDRPYEFYDVGVWAAEHPSEKIAMLQSGIASFVAPNVVNLDGKVNSDALRAHEQGRLPEYLRAERFTYIADFKPFISDIDSMCQKNELFFDSVGMVGNVQLMKLRTPAPDTARHF